MVIDEAKLEAEGMQVLIVPKSVAAALHSWLGLTIRRRQSDMIGTKAWELLDPGRQRLLNLAYALLAPGNGVKPTP